MLRVVLADDEKKVLLLMCKLIDWESLGFEIVGMASDGMHALEMIRDKQPHLLVTDIRHRHIQFGLVCVSVRANAAELCH